MNENYKPMRVLYVLSFGGGGGIERHLFNLVNSLPRDEVEPWICLIQKDGWETQQLAKDGVHVRVLGCKSGHDMRLATRFHSYLRECRPDIVHFQETRFMPMLIMALYPGIPLLCSGHCSVLMSPSPIRTRVIWRCFGWRVDYLLPVSEFTAAESSSILRVPERKIFLFRNAIDLADPDLENKNLVPDDAFPDWAGKRVVGGIGRLAPQKSWEDFLKVAALVARERDDVVFPIIGDGPLLEKLTILSREFGLNNKVAFLGWQNGIRYMRRFDVFLFTSLHEELPTILLEAFALGVPVAGFVPFGGTQEILNFAKRKPGFFVQGRDLKKLARQVLLALEDNTERDACAEEGQRIVREHFDMRKNACLLVKFYRQLLSR